VTYYPVSLSLPGAGMIAVLGRRYETLTDEFIQQWLSDLVRVYLVNPDYLLVTEQVRHDLYRIVMSDVYMSHWAFQYARNDKGEVAECYPNKFTGKPLTIVVFPGLPEKTLMVASLLEMKDEDVRVDGLSEVVTRTYVRLREMQP